MRDNEVTDARSAVDNMASAPSRAGRSPAPRFRTGGLPQRRFHLRDAALLLIGSGPVEAACKIIVGQRLKGAGMRWSQSGADAMLAVRTTLLSGQRQLLARYARLS